MQYREEDAVYDDGTQPYYRYGRQEDVPVRSRKVRIVAVVLCVILSLSILASGILYATGNVPSFLKSGSGSTESADTASASSAPEAAPVSTPHSITLERSMLVFQLVGEDGRKNTVMEYAYDRIAAPKGPAPLTKALADKSAEIDKAFRADPEIQGQLSYDDFHNVTGFQVYQHEADIRLERADDLVVSFVQINRINHGEAEFDYTRYDAATFDVTTGEPVRLDRLIRDRDALYEAVLAVLKKDPGRENVFALREEVAEDLRTYIAGDPVFTVDATGLRVWISSTTLGEGRIGACDAHISFAEHPDLFTENSYAGGTEEYTAMTVSRSPMAEEIYDLSEYLTERKITLKRSYFREMSGVWRKDGAKEDSYIRIDENGFLDYYDADGGLLSDGYLEAASSETEGQYDYYAFSGEDFPPELAGSVQVTGSETLLFTIDGVTMQMLFDSATE